MNCPTGETLPKMTEETRITMTGTLPETAETPEIEALQEAATREATWTEGAMQADSAPRAGIGTAVAAATTAVKEAATRATTATTTAKEAATKATTAIADRAVTKGTHRTVSVTSDATNPENADDPTATIGPHVTSLRSGQEEKPKSWDSNVATPTETVVSFKATATLQANKGGRKSTAHPA